MGTKPQVLNLLPVNISGDREQPRPSFKRQHVRPGAQSGWLPPLLRCGCRGLYMHRATEAAQLQQEAALFPVEGMSDLRSGDMKPFVHGHTAGRRQLTPQATLLTPAPLCLSRTWAAPGRHAPRTPHFHGRCPRHTLAAFPQDLRGHHTLLPPGTQLSKRARCTHTSGEPMAVTVYCAFHTAHGLALPPAASSGLPLVTSSHHRSCAGASCTVKAAGAEGPDGSPSEMPSVAPTGTGRGPVSTGLPLPLAGPCAEGRKENGDRSRCGPTMTATAVYHSENRQLCLPTPAAITSPYCRLPQVFI